MKTFIEHLMWICFAFGAFAVGAPLLILAIANWWIFPPILGTYYGGYFGMFTGIGVSMFGYLIQCGLEDLFKKPPPTKPIAPQNNRFATRSRMRQPKQEISEAWDIER